MEIKIGDIFHNNYLTVEVVSLSIKGQNNYLIKLLKSSNTRLKIGETYYIHSFDLRRMSKGIPSMDIE